VPFSSARRWSGAAFTGRGSWLLGAPEVLRPRLGDAAGRLDQLVAAQVRAGRRVLLLAHSPCPLTGPELPAKVEPVAVVVLAENLRPEAAETLRFFAAQGVAVKVISGDHPQTVGAIAAALGLAGADHPIDAGTLPEDAAALGAAVEEHSVFGRVDPHRKRALIHALQGRGHVVAMTGDGVNDVLALKDADVGVAMGAGSPATRAVAQLVLLDNRFDGMPPVVAEGRRVIGNVERVANLFLTKTVYATLLALTVGAARLPFPFLPRHLTLISAFSIGVPGFVLALAPNTRRVATGFVVRVLRFAIPAGVVAAAASFLAYAEARETPALPLGQARTTATLVLFGVALIVLARLGRPAARTPAWLYLGMAAGFAAALAIPISRQFFALPIPRFPVLLSALGVVAVAGVALELGLRLGARLRYNKPEGPAQPGLSTLGRRRNPAKTGVGGDAG
jgi:cation-transporting ATPase E